MSERSAVMPRTVFSLVCAIAPALALTACADYPLHANMSDSAIREKVAAEFPAGMSEPAVNAHLTELRVSEKWRWRYEAAPDRPRILLARLYQPGGFWVTHEDERIEWVDLSFLFGGADNTLTEVRQFRDGQRYFQGEAVNINSLKREPMGPVPDWPGSPPPPRDPLEGT